MAKCKFKFRLGTGEEWECPLEALPGEEFCYWHKEEEGKEPDDAKLSELKENEICGVFLRKAKLSSKELQNAFLSFANLQGADLVSANLQGADLWGANLQGANLIGVRGDSETRLDSANLTYANLYRSYLDETKTLRNAEFESEKEINEIVADFLKRRNKDLAVLDVLTIKGDNSEVVARLLEEELVWYVPAEALILNELGRYVSAMCVSVGKPMVFFDRDRRRVVKNPENAKSKIFQRLRKRGDSEEDENYVEISELNDLIERNGLEKYLYEGSREKLKELYEASYEVYNNLYYFYIQNGRLEEALRMHYRRCEVRRKLLREQGWINCLRSWMYDFFILKLLTGYGVKISRPLIASAIIISIFAFLFWLTNGIVKNVNGGMVAPVKNVNGTVAPVKNANGTVAPVKNVNGKMVAPDIVDYIYHSIITFTSLGYSNIQPNLAVGHIPQVLAAIESILGALMMALLIFTITYRVSR